MVAVLDVRGLRGQAEQQEILGQSKAEPGLPRQCAFFSKLAMAHEVRCLPFRLPRLAHSHTCTCLACTLSALARHSSEHPRPQVGAVRHPRSWVLASHITPAMLGAPRAGVGWGAALPQLRTPPGTVYKWCVNAVN